ncbi:hypothetical protein PQQ59_33325 [Paraburkholderia aspalathi]|uniref:hypothetical protein n=1 Tax=Paraburkholderia aspalathi TaxID=1324617 RepID=UPI0038B83CA0
MASNPPDASPSSAAEVRSERPPHLSRLVELATLGNATTAFAILLALISRGSLDTTLQIAFACAFVAAPTALAGFICREVILARSLSSPIERLRSVLVCGVFGALVLLGAALWEILFDVLIPLVGQIGVAAGFLWLIGVFVFAVHTLDRHRFGNEEEDAEAP